ncbi:unnamed protein product [Sphagnum balticum]
MGGDTHDASYYFKCMIGGLLACGITHTAIVPLDVAKCKKQIDPNYSKGIIDGVAKVRANGQITLGWQPTFVGYSLQGLGKFGFYEIFKDVYKAIVGEENAEKYKKVPYTIVKFVAFERFVQYFYDNVFTKPKETYSKGVQLGVTFASGYLAGIFCAIVSHPADTMVSKIYSKANQPGSTGQKVAAIYKEIGFNGLWAGLVTRIIMIGTLTGLQWWIYDTFKSAVGLATTGGGSKKA